jgi:hypothetical protein
VVLAGGVAACGGEDGVGEGEAAHRRREDDV